MTDREQLRQAQTQKVELALALEKAVIAKKLDEMKTQMLNLVDRMHVVLGVPCAAASYQQAVGSWLGMIEQALTIKGPHCIEHTITQLKETGNQRLIVVDRIEDVLNELAG